jgi:ATP-dependent helicase/nuclease subunit B
MRLATTGVPSWFEKGAAIITPSRLLARVTAEEFSAHQLQQGRHSWQRPAIYSSEAWLADCWRQARYAGVGVATLLSPSQERVLWQRIIEKEHSNLFDAGSTARLASRAARLLAEWQIPSDGELWNDHEDGQEFKGWSKIFRRVSRQEGWITRADAWNLLPRWICEGLCSRDLTVFAGFDLFTPALARAKDALGASAIVENVRARKAPGRIPAKRCADFPQEIEHAARWSRAMFEQNTPRSIGILVPGLATHRSLVERIFEQVLYPSGGGRHSDSVFHVNASDQLANHPLISSALLLLELASPRIEIADASAVLRSPFIAGAATERNERALADLDLRKRRELDVGLADLEFASRDCAQLKQVWSGVRSVLRRTKKQLEFAEWSELFADLTKAAGWPGEVAVTPEEREVAEAWKGALSELAALGLVSGPISLDSAVAHIRQLLSMPGVERGGWSSPIQILDASEAHGIEFDCAWAMGLSEDSWPPALAFHPLVPLKLQRAYHVPGSTPQSAQAERERMTQCVLQVAPWLIGSYSGRVSPLVEGSLSSASLDLPQWEGKLPRQSYAPAMLDEITDTNGPAYEQKESTRGGASLIKAQSQCPFRAFAEFRLAARTPEDGCFGFDSRERGGFLHAALQNVWNQIRTQERLLAMPREEIRSVVREAVAEAVGDGDSGPLHEILSRTERERLEELIGAWLDVERERKHRFTVETVEQERYYELPGLRLRLRVDRIDRLKNGKLILIDYKSGLQSRNKLECPRPPEPQLLVYASALGSEVDGVFFGELKPRDPRAVGFAREKHFPGQAAAVRKDWDSFLLQSRSEIQRLATGFVQGHAVVDPIKGACEYCGIRSFCRVNEKIAHAQDEE